MRKIFYLIFCLSIAPFAYGQKNTNVDLGSTHHQDVLDFNRQISIIKNKMNNSKYDDAAQRAKLLIVQKQFYKEGMPEAYALLIESLCKLGNVKDLEKYAPKAQSLGVNTDSLTVNCSENKNNPELVKKRSVSFLEIGSGHRFGSDTISQLDLYNRNIYFSLRHHMPINNRGAIALNILININDFGYPYLDNRKRPKYHGDSMIVNKYRVVSFQIGLGYEYLASEKWNLRLTPNFYFFLPIRESIWVPNDKMYRNTMLLAADPYYISVGLDIEKRFKLNKTYIGIGANYRFHTYEHKPHYIGGFARIGL